MLSLSNKESQNWQIDLLPKVFKILLYGRKHINWSYRFTRYSDNFPNKEVYGLTLQLSRAGVSVPANIAKGFKKSSNADKKRFMNIAQSSLEAYMETDFLKSRKGLIVREP